MKPALSATSRITFGLACLAASIVLFSQTLGLIPDRNGAIMDGRRALAEASAINCSLFASEGELRLMKASLRAIQERHQDLLSAGIRKQDGTLIFQTDQHDENWQQPTKTNAVHMFVPVMAGNDIWGTIEFRFRPLNSGTGIMAVLLDPMFSFIVFIVATSFGVYYVYLKKMLQHLDPSNVIPERVRTALDALAEGLLVLDRDERIVLANKAFADFVGRLPEELQGRLASDLPWTDTKTQLKHTADTPWVRANSEGTSQTGSMMGLETKEQNKSFIVNSAPIMDEAGQQRGVLTTFSDVTKLEEKKIELSRMLVELETSRALIQKQNRNLKVLAREDSLTGCVNRRAFFTEFEKQWSVAQRHGHSLSCVMVDVDHFKVVNDRFGYQTGDKVLQKVAEALKLVARDTDLVCRYGGEEFCILLTDTNIDSAVYAAERFRNAIEAIEFADLSITASLGIAAMSQGASSPHELLDWADKCLYVAKRNGRNQVVRWDEVPDDFDSDQAIESCVAEKLETADAEIPFRAVTAMISALAYRDTATAEHCRRVADYCVVTAQGMMSLTAAYRLEIAALLHDLGKIGVPDRILLKPGPLTPEEWDVMRTHDAIGVEIIRASFACPAVLEIVETHHAFYGGDAKRSGLPTGEDIHLGARILCVADAYDAMVSDRVYRKGMSQEDAFAELRRCSGTQFDPKVTEHFIETMLARNENRPESVAQVSKETALQIGLQIERLTSAFDKQDYAALTTLASRLKQTATTENLPEIAKLAGELEESMDGTPDLIQFVGLTHALLETCRSAQIAYIKDPREHVKPSPIELQSTSPSSD